MQIPIESVADLGLVVRAVRRSSRVRLDDVSAMAALVKQFTSDVEHGKPTVQFGLVMKLLAELGVRLTAELPESAEQELVVLKLKGGLPPPRKRRAKKHAEFGSDTS